MMEEEAKVLVGCPVFDGVRYCIKRFLERIRDLDYDNYEILLFDNSRGDDFFDELKKEEGIKVLKDDTKEQRNLFRLISSRNKILEYAIENNFDYILMMDADVIPPREIIRKLLSWKKEVVSGLYYNYFDVEGEIKKSPVAWKFLTAEEFAELKRLGIKLSFDAKKREDVKRDLMKDEIDPGFLEVDICSAGCMLVSRKVFEKARYSVLEEEEKAGKMMTDDVSFLKDVRELGFKIYCDTSLKCEHLVEEKTSEDGTHPVFK